MQCTLCNYRSKAVAGALVNVVIESLKHGKPMAEALAPAEELVGVLYWQTITRVHGEAAGKQAKEQISRGAKLLLAVYEEDGSVARFPEIKKVLLSADAFGVYIGKVMWNAIGVGIPSAITRRCMALQEMQPLKAASIRCALGPFINIIQAACDQQEARSKGICKEEKEDEGEEEGETSTEEEEEESTDQEEDSEEQVHFEWNIDGGDIHL